METGQNVVAEKKGLSVMPKSSLVAVDNFFPNHPAALPSVCGTIFEVISLWKFVLGKAATNWFPRPSRRDGR